jgi:hypothetical protein
LIFRQISETSLDSILSEDDALYYIEGPRQGESLWSRFKRWIYDTFFSWLDSSDARITFQTFFILLGIIGAVLIFYFLQLGRKKTELSRKDVRWGDVHTNPTVIEDLDYQKWIDTALDRGEYNEVIKFLYLFTIKRLNDGNHLRYRPQYTNRQVIRKLKTGQIKDYFVAIASQFEYVWYGHFEADELQTVDLKNNFEQLFPKAIK